MIHLSCSFRDDFISVLYFYKDEIKIVIDIRMMPTSYEGRTILQTAKCKTTSNRSLLYKDFAKRDSLLK